MLTLGINGNFGNDTGDLLPGMADYYFHDASACLVRDGETVAAIEQERVNRIKKTTKFPSGAIWACLVEAGVSTDEVDAVGFYFDETFTDHALNSWYVENARIPLRYARELIRDRLREDLGWDLADDKLFFTPHHVSHAESVLARSGQEESLVVVLDARGEEHSGTVFRGVGGELESLATYSIAESLGTFYESAINLVGYRFGDEYKVMGLAPYGDPSTYRELFDTFYALAPDGGYQLNPAAPEINLVAPTFLEAGVRPRRKGEPLTQVHKDFAAGLQEMLETIVLHVLRHWRQVTGLSRLCFTGGVAHNSSLNGVIARSDLFDEVFIHPSAHDAGAGEGAALAAARRLGAPRPPVARLRTAALGPSLGARDTVELGLKGWDGLVTIEQATDVVEHTAELLAAGDVVGWVQGRSEFGPRALGQRSILADPRPAENQTAINAMVKRRESFRPFAPSVTGEAAEEFFELDPARANLDFMSFVVPVRREHRATLGAVTHVDGTARVQVVDAEVLPTFHRLIEEFGRRTGTPVLLNTSFNNDAEPIVDSIDDAVTCFLTTGLDVLVVDDFVVRRRDRATSDAGLDDLVVRFRPVTSLISDVRSTADGSTVPIRRIGLDYATGPWSEISETAHAVLFHVDGTSTLGELCREALGVTPDEALRAEIVTLWEQRLLVLLPPGRE